MLRYSWREEARIRKKVAAVSIPEREKKAQTKRTSPKAGGKLHCTIVKGTDRAEVRLRTTQRNINEGVVLFNVIYTKQLGEQQLRD